jgi:SpoVK/Ycf46/Vps4 family AAA+-type ATPase
LELSPPTRAELIELIAEEANAWSRESGRPVRRDEEAVAANQRQLAGLTHGDARRLIRVAIRDDGILDERDLPAVIAAKHRLLDGDGALALELDVARPDDVAGLERLKRWLAERAPSFTAERPLTGLDPPRGVLLLGVQGAGKSLAARAVAGAWRVPLLRLDFAALYDKYVGETERKLRVALKTATVMAPCVLWIDEIEKGLAAGGEESGPGKRVLGTLLTWMAERRERVFLVATANDIEALPPELMRKGRFDEIFFVDLPGPAAREAIVRIHARKRGLDPALLDAAAIAAATDGYSGAEIEQALIAALYAAHARGEPLTTRHVIEAAEASRPLSVLMAERIAALRAWAAERTVSAD